MLSIAIIVFREVLEIAVVVSVLLAATRGLPARGRWVWGGVLAGAAGSGAVAVCGEAIGAWAEGMGQELFNAAVLFAAAVLIAWTTIWMARHGRLLAQHFKTVGLEVAEGRKPYSTLAAVTALSVLREGSEIVLFTYGVVASGQSAASVFLGGVGGLAGGVLVGTAMYLGLVKISSRHLFSVTGWLLVFLAASMVSQAMGFLAAGGFVPEIVYPVWDTSGWLSQRSLLGEVLHALLGYTEKPSGIQLLGFLITGGGLAMLLKRYGNKPSDGAARAGSVSKNILVLFLLASGFLCLPARPALAGEKVYSPIVEKGEVELEARGSYDFDDEDKKDGVLKEKYAVGYGVTDRWFTEVYGNFKKSPGHEFDMEAVEWENILQLFEQGRYPVDAGLYVAYAFGVEDDERDEIEGKLLLEKEIAPFLHRANIVFEKEVGGGEKKDLEGGIDWSSRYRLQPSFEPGVEYHSEFIDGSKHQLGPVLYGELGGHWKYEVGYLFGVSDDAPDGALKWVVEYGFRF